MSRGVRIPSAHTDSTVVILMIQTLRDIEADIYALACVCNIDILQDTIKIV